MHIMIHSDCSSEKSIFMFMRIKAVVQRIVNSVELSTKRHETKQSVPVIIVLR